MPYKGAIQQHCSIAILIHDNPGTACICIFGIYDASAVMFKLLWWQSLLTAVLFITVRGKNDCIFQRNKSYCTHALRYLMVEEATPYPAGSSMVAISLIPTRTKAM